jgi:hypothetical protein
MDGDKAQDVRNCSVTQYEFDPSAGMNGKLILRDFNRVYYLSTLRNYGALPSRSTVSSGESLDARTLLARNLREKRKAIATFAESLKTEAGLRHRAEAW